MASAHESFERTFCHVRRKKQIRCRVEGMVVDAANGSLTERRSTMSVDRKQPIRRFGRTIGSSATKAQRAGGPTAHQQRIQVGSSEQFSYCRKACSEGEWN